MVNLYFVYFTTIFKKKGQWIKKPNKKVGYMNRLITRKRNKSGPETYKKNAQTHS